jgi:hypothetical protein
MADHEQETGPGAQPGPRQGDKAEPGPQEDVTQAGEEKTDPDLQEDVKTQPGEEDPFPQMK